MCIFPDTGQSLVKKKADHDIVGYKVVHSTGSKYTDKRKFLTGLMYKPISADEISGRLPFSDPDKPELKNYPVIVDRGCIHSYARLEDAVKLMHKSVGTADYYPTIFKVVIPKGTEYYEGYTGNPDDKMPSYASRQIIFKEQLYCRIKNTDYEYKVYKVEEDDQNKKKKLSHEKIPFE